MNSDKREYAQKDSNESKSIGSASQTDSRRKFMAKASAGALISTIPAKSVWATGLTNSIIASGHGSDFTGNTAARLRGPWYWRNNPSEIPTFIGGSPFASISLFGGAAWKGDSEFYDSNLTVLDILTTPLTDDNGNVVLNGSGNPRYKYYGRGGINARMISIVLNAEKHGTGGIHYPILGPGKPFPNYTALASHLYNNSKKSIDKRAYGLAMGDVLQQTS